jgi:uncharacterized protein
MIDLDPRHLDLVRRILVQNVPHCEVWIFGSRVSGQAKEYSDIDLVIIGGKKLDFDTLRVLREAFVDSVLPMRVDVLDWHATSQAFRDVILKAGYEVLQRTPDAAGNDTETTVEGER